MNKKVIYSSITIIAIIIIGVFIIRRQYKDNLYFGSLKLPFGTPNQETDWITQADQLFVEGDYEQAFQVYTKAIQSGINEEQAFTRRGEIYTIWKRFQEASQEFTRALEIVRDADVLSERCNSYRLLAKYDLALADCQESIVLDPNNIDGYVALASLHAEQSKFEEAYQTIQSGIQIDPKSDKAYYVLSLIELYRDNVDNATEALTYAIQLNPNVPQYYWDRGFIFYTLGKLSEAKHDMQSVVEIGNPKIDGELMYHAGSLLDTLQGIP